MRGAGSQLMHSSMSNKQTQRGMIEEQARNLLNSSERTTMNYYLSEYQQGNIEVEALSLALIELLNTDAKVIDIPSMRLYIYKVSEGCRGTRSIFFIHSP